MDDARAEIRNIMDKGISGSCLCGKVTSTIQGPFQKFYQCFCKRCQKKTGSAFAALIMTSRDSIDWHSGKDLVRRFDLPEAALFSSCFCSECGSQVPYVSRGGNALIIPAGYLSDDPEVRPAANIFWEERACWFDEGQSAKTYEGYP